MMLRQRTRGVSSFVAALMLVVISLSLSYVVYQGVRDFGAVRAQGQQQEDTFANQATLLEGSPDVLRIIVNASQPATPLVLEAGSVSSESGILYYDGSGYGTASSLCLANSTTFFSVYAASPETIRVTSDGRSWIDGYWADSLPVQAGWHELMLVDASACQVSGPDATFTYPSPAVSSVPAMGVPASRSFTFYLPCSSPGSGSGPGSGDGRFLIVFDGGYDQVAD